MYLDHFDYEVGKMYYSTNRYGIQENCKKVIDLVTDWRNRLIVAGYGIAEIVEGHSNKHAFASFVILSGKS